MSTTIADAAANVALGSEASWAWDVTTGGTVVVGGHDHVAALAQARAAGHTGPIIRLYGGGAADVASVVRRAKAAGLD